MNGPYGAARLLPKAFLTANEFMIALYATQRGRCAICCTKHVFEDLVVERDPATGRVRGLVCLRCVTSRIGSNTIETIVDVLRYFQMPPGERFYRP